MRFIFSAVAVCCALCSLYTFLLCGFDKNAARHQKRRVPEKRFFLLCLCGGAYGLAAGMLCFRHKTRHASFVICASIGLIFWTTVLFLLWAWAVTAWIV